MSKYQVILKVPFSVTFSGNMEFQEVKIIFETKNIKKALMFAYEKWSTEKGHDFPALQNCYLVKKDDKDICTFGYQIVETTLNDIDKEIFQNLIAIEKIHTEKETPMKPNNFDKEYCMYNCPNCSKVNATFKFSYCPHCGQKLDWSKE